MSDRIATLALWLFVINLGIAFGAGLYEHRIVVPDWISTTPGGSHWHPDAVRVDDTGRRFWILVTTIPLTLLTLINLVAGWQSRGPQRGWWLTAAIAALADRAMTFGYFIPTMVRLMDAPDSAASVAAATLWSNLNYVRHAIVLAAWLAALKAFALAGSRGTSG